MPDIGYTGSQGEQGPPGNIGFTGSRAYTGSQGFTGSRGYSGWIGSRGYLGWTGSRGFLGYHGSRGWTGSRGLVGFVGSYGPIGYTGSRGAGWVGSRGIQGLLGYTGSRGAGWTGSQGPVGFTGSMGWLGYTGSAGAGYTGSIGGPGPIGFTGSQGITGRIAVEVIIVGETTDANTLPETANTGETWLVNDNFFIYHTDQWWDIGPARGPAGYIGSQGPQGLPSMLPNYLGSLIDAGELPDANTSANNDAFTAEGHLWMYRDTEGWMDLGAWEGRAGYTGSTGYTGSRGPTGITLNLVGDLEDIVDRPDANTVPPSTAYVIGSDLHFTNAANTWVVVDNFVGPVGPIGYTGSVGPMAAANAASGANGAIQFANSGIMAGASNFTINDAGSPPTLTGNGRIALTGSGNMLQLQMSSNTASRYISITNENILDGYDAKRGIRFRSTGSGGTTGVVQFSAADAATITIDPNQTTLHATSNLRLAANGVADIVSLTANTTTATMSVGGANNTLFNISSNAIIALETTAAAGVRVGRQADSISRLTVLYPGTTSPVMDINGTSETVTLGANVGLSLGSATAPGGVANDVSRHLAIYGTQYGFTVTSGRMNAVVNTNANLSIVTMAGVDAFNFDTSTGYLNMGVTGGGIRVSSSDSASTPGFSWGGDPDNGMYRRGTNSIGFSTAGNEAFYITSAGIPTFPLVANSAAAAFNVSMNANGAIFKTSSSIRTKTDVQDLDLANSLNFIREARPVWYRSLNAMDRADWSFIGLIAEEVDQIEPRFVAYSADETDENGVPVEGATLVPETVDYARMVVPLIQVVQHLLEKNADLEDRLAAVESQLGAS